MSKKNQQRKREKEKVEEVEKLLGVLEYLEDSQIELVLDIYTYGQSEIVITTPKKSGPSKHKDIFLLYYMIFIIILILTASVVFGLTIINTVISNCRKTGFYFGMVINIEIIVVNTQI